MFKALDNIFLSTIKAVMVAGLLYSSSIMAIYATETLTDPTRPAFHSVVKNKLLDYDGQTFKVSQIFISSRKRMAIVNGQTVRRGDTIGNASVVAIESDSVHLLIDGKIKQVSIMPSIKQYK